MLVIELRNRALAFLVFGTLTLLSSTVGLQAVRDQGTSSVVVVAAAVSTPSSTTGGEWPPGH